MLVPPTRDGHRDTSTALCRVFEWGMVVRHGEQCTPERLYGQERSRSVWEAPGENGRTQMSTFSERVVPVFTSNSSGARYGIVECSAAMSYRRSHQQRSALPGQRGLTCCRRACCRFSIKILALDSSASYKPSNDTRKAHFTVDPKSIRIGDPSSATMIFLDPTASAAIPRRRKEKAHPGLISRCA